MKTQTKTPRNSAFERFASHAAKATGSNYAFTIAVVIVIAWAACGPIFDYSETWQLVINTGTTIITFLMVFLIQKAQNKDSLAIQLKLNELVASSEYASNRVVDIENMTEDEMMIIQKYYRSLSELSKKDESLQTSHSIEEAEDQHEVKSSKIRQRTSHLKNIPNQNSANAAVPAVKKGQKQKSKPKTQQSPEKKESAQKSGTQKPLGSRQAKSDSQNQKISPKDTKK